VEVTISAKGKALLKWIDGLLWCRKHRAPADVGDIGGVADAAGRERGRRKEWRTITNRGTLR